MGDLKVNGNTLAEVRERIREILPTKFYRQRLPSGTENQIGISRDEIALQMAEFRPVYVAGDVTRPGEKLYRPGMTARQAISVAEGYDVQSLRGTSSMVELADLQGERNVLEAEAAQMLAIVQRLEAERDRKPSFAPDLKAIALSQEVRSQIEQTESERFKVRLQNHEQEKAYLNRVLKQADDRVQKLVEQQKADEEAARLESEDYERVRELLQRGVVATTRAVEARRLSLSASTRFAQTSAEVEGARRDRENIVFRLSQIDEQRRAEILRELQDASAKLAAARSKLNASERKLTYTGMTRSQLLDENGYTTKLTIVRNGTNGPVELEASEDMILLPGDVVNVAVRASRPPTTTQERR
jgi:polysaccharide export outer membrane protein